MSSVRHVLGISGGKDSTALAVYLRKHYPELDIEYYFCDTGKELEETYELLVNLEVFLGRKITRLKAAKDSPQDPFDHFLQLYGGFLPSSNARWCTKKLKLEPFEEFVGDLPVISYVAIRGDEERDAYISKKPNIQSIFPFRKNIWSEDVTYKILSNDNIPKMAELYEKILGSRRKDVSEVVTREISPSYIPSRKLSSLLSFGVSLYNQVVYEFLKGTDYPLRLVDSFPLVGNEDVIRKEDVIRILTESGIGLPRYYERRQYEINGEKGFYSRSRSGCYFCFYQQKIEWVWLLERHPDLFAKALKYEKDGFTWMPNERLEDLMKPERVKQIKEEHLKRSAKATSSRSGYLVHIIEETEGDGCAACFI